MTPARFLRLIVLVATLAATRFGGRAASGSDAWFDHRTSGAIVCRANFTLADHDAFFADLAQMQLDLRQALQLKAPREPVELYLFKDQRGYRQHLQTYLPDVPYRPSLFVKGAGPGRIYSYQCDEMATNLRHESTHGVLHAILPEVPLWLDEGLAEYFEVAAEDRASGNPHFANIRWSVRLGRVPQLSKLEQLRDVSEMTTADYRRAWAWVHFLLHGSPEAHEELIQFLADTRDGKPPGQLSERLQRRIPDVEQRLVRHFKHWSR